jgi:hypothetical protein
MAITKHRPAASDSNRASAEQGESSFAAPAPTPHNKTAGKAGGLFCNWRF